MLNVPQAGVAVPALGFDVETRVAPPKRFIEVVELYVNPLGVGLGSESEIVKPRAVP
jgi:hypothetical protein